MAARREGLRHVSPDRGEPPRDDPQFGARIASICASYPDLCVTYDHGLFAGKTFNIGDYIASSGIYEGHLAFDHGWVGVMLVEAALSTSDPAKRASTSTPPSPQGCGPRRTLHAQPQLHRQEPLLLASLDDYLGEARWPTAMLDRAERCIMPGALMDTNGDGEVDGMRSQPFSALTPVAQRPGRMWDGHNARHRFQATTPTPSLSPTSPCVIAATRPKPHACAPTSSRCSTTWQRWPRIPSRGVPASGRVQVSYALALGLYASRTRKDRSSPSGRTRWPRTGTRASARLPTNPRPSRSRPSAC